MILGEFETAERKLRNSGEVIHLLKGAFEFYFDGELYSEETFRIYQTKKDLSLLYYSDQQTPLSTGEFQKSYLIYKVTQDWAFLESNLNKFMGKHHVEEKYKVLKKENMISYEFVEDGEIKKLKLALPPKFQVSTPHLASTFIFISSKKYDSSGKNYHNLMVSKNEWKFLGVPKMEYILLKRPYNKKVDMKLKGNKIRGLMYEVYSDDNYEKTKETPLRVYMSSLYNIPYIVEPPGGLKITVRYLHEIDKDPLEDGEE